MSQDPSRKPILTFEMLNEDMEAAFEEVERAARALANAKRRVNVIKDIAGFRPNYHCASYFIEEGFHCSNCVRNGQCNILVSSDYNKEHDVPVCRYYTNSLQEQ